MPPPRKATRLLPSRRSYARSWRVISTAACSAEGSHTSRAPVIIWTSKDLTTEEERLLRASAQAVLSKDPDGTSTVLEEIRAFRRPQAS